MRYGVFSDVHSNGEALGAVLKALEGERVDRLLCAGDLVGYAAEPGRCVDAVRAVAHGVVAGNHDWAAVGKFSSDWFHKEAKLALLWTGDRMGGDARRYLEDLPLTWRDDEVTLAHGTLHEPEAFHYLFDGDIAAESFFLQKTPVAFVGHTHVPVAFAREQDGGIRLLRGPRVRLAAGAHYLVNVGSVGQPRDHHPQAAYCVYDAGEKTVEFKRVAYPVAVAQEKIRAAGLPAWFAERLRWGV